MDFWFVATVSALLLFNLDLVKTLDNDNITSTPTIKTTPTPQPCPTYVPSPSAPILGFLSVHWRSKCEGRISLTQLDSSEGWNSLTQLDSDGSKPLCYSSGHTLKELLTNLCEEKKGCEGSVKTKNSEKKHPGLEVTANGFNKTYCKILTIKCKEERPPEAPSEPVGYKVATALLCLFLIFLFLLRFARPTIKTLQKRLSNKRQNRWIGPTQSHSVSYHRGQAVTKSMDGDKLSSYPALDQLVVGNPSSNRNSYNF